jgi:hypothetical protein
MKQFLKNTTYVLLDDVVQYIHVYTESERVRE